MQYRPASVVPEPIYMPESKAHFPADEFVLIHKIWGKVPHRTSSHAENGYHLILDDKRKVIVTKDRIELARKARHRPEAAYVAACEHAHQFWNGQMEVHGDSAHRAKSWAYASVHGIQITNFQPTDRELLEAEEIMRGLRKTIEPSFRRPSVKAAPGSKPIL